MSTAPHGYPGVPGLVVTLDDAGVLRLHLDRPSKRNALDDTMVAAMITTLGTAERDERVRAVLVTAEGAHFCTGADIVARNEPGQHDDPRQPGEPGQPPNQPGHPNQPDASTPTRPPKPRPGAIQRRLPHEAHRLVPLLAGLQAPVVVAVRGWAAGVGLSLTLAADFAVAATDARFWAPFSARGFTPDGGTTWLLPRRVGEVRARRMLLLGDRVDGVTAHQWGLVDRVVPSEDVDREARELARRLAAGPTVALGLTRWLLHASASATFEQQLRDEAFAMELSSRSHDFREGLAAFAQRRDPDFQGR